MQKLSTGEDATLGNYRILSALFFGEDSLAVQFLDAKIAKEGKDAEVIAEESQMLHVLAQIHSTGESCTKRDDGIGC